MKAEALYYQLDRTNVFTNGILAANVNTGYITRHDTNGVIARAGINFKFGSF
ncbi:MAG: hypothetical protein INR63_28820 [Actinomycetospora chiangmaiensis]|nr:hypothetical protein [Actinomycetospora chiangmaiensis]